MAINLLERLFGSRSQADITEVRLFTEAMLIMIAADGVVEESELDQFVLQVRTRPEFKGIKQKVIDAHVQSAFADIRRDGLDRRIEVIAEGLPAPNQRLAALGMAMSIALGDGGVVKAEKTVLEKMRMVFGVDRKTFNEIRKAIAEGTGFDDAATEGSVVGGEPLLIETILLMAAADGVLDPSELDRFGYQLAEHEEFSRLTPEQAAHFLDRALRNLEKEGVEARIEAIAEGLTTTAQRTVAFRLALEMCIADGSADPHERTLLKILQHHFGLDDDDVKKEIDRVLGGME